MSLSSRCCQRKDIKTLVSRRIFCILSLKPNILKCSNAINTMFPWSSTAFRILLCSCRESNIHPGGDIYFTAMHAIGLYFPWRPEGYITAWQLIGWDQGSVQKPQSRKSLMVVLSFTSSHPRMDSKIFKLYDIRNKLDSWSWLYEHHWSCMINMINDH